MSLEWMNRASCMNDPAPECWFPEVGGTPEAQRAVRVCFGCPVRSECLEYHLSIEREAEPLGIAGGLFATERRRLLRAS